MKPAAIGYTPDNTKAYKSINKAASSQILEQRSPNEGQSSAVGIMKASDILYTLRSPFLDRHFPAAQDDKYFETIEKKYSPDGTLAYDKCADGFKIIETAYDKYGRTVMIRTKDLCGPETLEEIIYNGDSYTARMVSVYTIIPGKRDRLEYLQIFDEQNKRKMHLVYNKGKIAGFVDEDGKFNILKQED